METCRKAKRTKPTSLTSKQGNDDHDQSVRLFDEVDEQISHRWRNSQTGDSETEQL